MKTLYVTADTNLDAVLRSFDVQSSSTGLADSYNLLGLDIETYPTDMRGVSAEFCSKRAKIRLIQVSDGETCAVFDLMKMSDEQKDTLKVFLQINKYFIHNALFDVRFLQEWGIPFVQSYCTMTMYSLILRSRYPDSKRYSTSLKEAVKQVFHEDISKLEQTSDWSAPELSEHQIEYAALDAYWVYKLGRALMRDPAVRTENFRITNSVINAIARIIRNGIYMDTAKLDTMIAEWEKGKDEAEKECAAVYGNLNLRSNLQLGDWLKEHLPEDILAVWPKTEKGSLKTDAGTLAEYESLQGIAPLVRFKKYQKYLSTYGDSMKRFINPVTGRLHPQYTIAFTESGRLSSMNPNVQNFPRGADYRSLFVPQWKSTTFVCADYSQVEVRVAAVLSKDKKMLEAYRTGKDLYKLTASLILHKPEDEITKAERQRAKAVVLGLQFGMGARKLCLYAKQYGVNMSEAESEELVANYRLAYPDLYRWQQETTQAASVSMKATTVGGMIRKLSQDNYYTCSLNTPVQGSAAEAILYTIELLDRDFIVNKTPAKIVATVHDEILVECRKDVAESVKETLEQAMMLGFSHVFPENYGAINNIVEAHIGESWYDSK